MDKVFLVVLAGFFFNLYLSKRDRVRHLEKFIESKKEMGLRRIENLSSLINLLKQSRILSATRDFYLAGLDAAFDILVMGKDPQAVLWKEKKVDTVH